MRILFPGAGLLVLSAWCLGVLNSHRRFFLSYAAPVLWNVAMIASLVGVRAGAGSRTGWPRSPPGGRWLGSLLQFGVQLPTVARLLGGLRPRLSAAPPRCGEVLRNFGPVFVGRGVVQISAYVDTVLASLLPTGAVAGLSYAQMIYTLPVSLFGMSVSAAELPAMSSAVGQRGRARGLPPGPARRGAAPDRVLRRPLGGGVPRARRRRRRRAVSVGRLHARR